MDSKTQLQLDMKPVKIKHFSIGSKVVNSLLTRFRTGRTSLNLHRFTIGQEDYSSCMCHAKEESPVHFMIDCFLFTAERQTLFDLVGHYIPKFSTLSEKLKCESLISGL